MGPSGVRTEAIVTVLSSVSYDSIAMAFKAILRRNPFDAS
jgi:hypothetical protein